MKLKIIKQIHAYSDNNNEEYLIYRKTLFNGWKKFDVDFNNISQFKKKYEIYQDAENDIIRYYSKNLGGIIEIDGNIYTLYPLSLPLP